jgi:radical SAM protein with 4Fe4S-binding SPASM domain
MKNKTFCPAPFMAISTDVNGSLRPCCKYAQPHEQVEHKMPWMTDVTLNEAWNGPEFKKLRQAFIDGEKPNECKSCWFEEDTGIPSYREYFLKRFEKKSINYKSVIVNSPVYIDLKLSNVCNLKCRICSATASSLIQKEQAREYGIKGDIYWQQDKISGTYHEESFKSWIPHINYLCFTGGEPFLGQENKKLLQLIIDEGYADKIDLHFNTNGMQLSDTILNLLMHYKYISIAFSVDDIGERLAYSRHGADWERIIQNIKKVPRTKQFRTDIYTTISSYNIWYVAESYPIFKKLTPNISYDFVYGPDYLSPRNLNKSIKYRIAEKYKALNNLYFEKLIEYIQGDGEDLTLGFHENIRELDRIRKEDFENIFPEWAQEIMFFPKITLK